MSTRIPRIVRPVTLPAATLTIEYDSAATEVASLPAVTRYNSGGAVASDDLFAFVLAAIAAVSAFGWSVSAVSSAPYLRRRFALVGATDFPTSFSFSSSAWSLALGFDTTNPAPGVTPVGPLFTSLVIPPWTPQGAWTPHSPLITPLVQDPRRREDSVVLTQTPGGYTTLDHYGGYNVRTVEMVRLYAANVLDHYRALSGFHGGQGDLDGADPHYSWESFRKGWMLAGVAGRYYPDRDDSTGYSDCYARMPWIAGRGGVTEFSRAPLLYNVVIDLLEPDA
jgi:hypothetical protein